MAWKLVKFEQNYADEFDVFGIRLMTEKEFKEYLAEAKKANYPVELYFGTNEQVDFDNFEDFQNSLTVERLSATAAQVISDKVGDSIGWFPDSLADNNIEDGLSAAGIEDTKGGDY